MCEWGWGIGRIENQVHDWNIQLAARPKARQEQRLIGTGGT